MPGRYVADQPDRRQARSPRSSAATRSSAISRAGRAPKMPRLLTRMSTVGQLRRRSPSTPVVGGDVGRDAEHVDRRGGLAQLVDRLVDPVRRAAVHRDAGAAAGQPLRDGLADALGGSGDECGLSGQVDVHAAVLPPRARTIPPTHETVLTVFDSRDYGTVFPGPLRLRDDARATPDDVRNPSDGGLAPKVTGPAANTRPFR